MVLVWIEATKPAIFRSPPSSLTATMALRDAWLSAPEGRLCAWQQACALALREASTELHGAPWLPWIAERVTKVTSRCGVSLSLAQTNRPTVPLSRHSPPLCPRPG